MLFLHRQFLHDRAATERLARSDCGKPSRLRFVVSRRLQHMGNRVIAHKKRRPCCGRSRRLRNQAKLHQSKTQTSILFGDPDRSPAMFDDCLPENLVIGAGLFQQADQSRLVNALIENASSLARDRFLFFAQYD
ncbi:MAG: hypothetical protein N2423_01110 [Novosphingobium sp.]|nr:hypothetical protein [Novosphingobium sp.]